MKKETRTVVYDEELRLEAYGFERIVQPLSESLSWVLRYRMGRGRHAQAFLQQLVKDIF